MMEAIKNKYDFMILFDVENGNPNGDPDADNMPRIDPETNLGIVTDVCLKRKIRNYVNVAREFKEELQEGFEIYIQSEKPLNAMDTRAYAANDIEYDEKSLKFKTAPKDEAKALLDLKVRDFMCQNFYDIRTFGAVMTTHVKNNLNAGQVRGPVQLSFARSIDPIFSQNIAITRQAQATQKDLDEKGKGTIGRKYVVPYGLYQAEGYVSASLSQISGFNEQDIALLWEAIINMFEHDRSAARGKMVLRELIVFKHDNPLGNAPSHKLFDLVKIEKLNAPARHYSDYGITVDKEALPDGVTVERRV
ncbi:MAG: type I-C CRISPR-associated protein Cas7/Csd2 [Defluviitaleaceae bacterium]|nr:type I-C CRISPR-associated protein Cas7/Csd2 [Defluviitaleaceae bacterium]